MKVKNKPWWNYLSEDLQESLELSFHLSERSAEWSNKYHDYSFLVFPAAKAYEGFLKKIFLDMGFITKEDYNGKHFRIGKALNPNLESKYKGDDWVYKKLSKFCGGDELPDRLWRTWKESRNLLFHWFPNEKNVVSHAEAVEKLLMIVGAIDEVFSVCSVELNKNGSK
jgi:hypothetical protein